MTGKRLVFAAAFLALLLPLLAGCGRIDVDLRTTVQTSGDIKQVVVFTASGLLADVFDDAEIVAGLEAGGWEVSLDNDSASTTLTLEMDFIADDVLTIPALNGGEDNLEDYSFNVRNFFFYSEYLLEVTIPGDFLDVAADDINDQGGFGGITGQILEDIFGMSWTISLPGEIVESNADSVQGNSATWTIDFGGQNGGQLISVHSRLVNWPVIAGGAAGLAVLAAVVVFLLLRRRAALPA